MAWGIRIWAGPLFSNGVIDGRNAFGSKEFSNRGHDSTISFCNSEEYLDYLGLQGYSEHHLLHLTSYFKKHFKGKTFQTPLEMQKYIAGKGKGIRHLTKTARSYLNYAEKFERIPIEVIEKYRKFLKVKESQPDVFVPSDKDVLETYNSIKKDPDLKLIFLILATSGIRYVECLQFLRTYEIPKFKEFNGFVSYDVSNNRKTKNINNIYLPTFVYRMLRYLDIDYELLRNRFNRFDSKFTLKYLRKWQYNFLLYSQVPESVADFIQGRVNKSVASNHYLAKTQQANYWYERVVEKFELCFSSFNIK